jgi:hypothetical protein
VICDRERQPDEPHAICAYEHHHRPDGTPEKGSRVVCPKCGGPAVCGPFMHACRKCDPFDFALCGICRTPRVFCCC